MYESYRLEHITKKLEHHQCPIQNMNFCACTGQVQGILVKDMYHLDILYQLFTGQLPADHGRIYINDRLHSHPSLPALRAAGVHCIGHHTQLAFHLNIAENIVMISGSSDLPFFTNSKRIYQEVQPLLEAWQLPFSADAFPHELSAPNCHLAEVIKGVYHHAHIFIIDDIFFDYSIKDFELFGKVVQQLVKNDCAVIYFTRIWDHDFFNFTTSLNIVRQGTIIINIPQEHFQELPSLLSFHDFSNQLEYEKTEAIDNTSTMLQFHIHFPSPVSVLIHFSLEEQEILGIYDRDCQIIDLFNDLLTGHTACNGRICFGQSVYTLKNQKFVNKKIGLITSRASEDYNYFPQMSIMDNVTLMIQKDLCYPFGIFNRRLQKYLFRKILTALHCNDIIEENNRLRYHPRTPVDPYTQFKVLIARYICAGYRILLIENPQNLYDSSNIGEFTQLLRDLLALKVSVILISPNYHILNATCSHILTAEQWSSKEVSKC